MKIGVLDDSPAILGYLETTLTLDGHTVSSYQSSTSFFDALSPHQPSEELPYDLVILDLALPGQFSGVDIFHALKKRFPARHFSTMLITAVGESTVEQVRRYLPDDVPVLQKPFSLRTLRQQVTHFALKKISEMPQDQVCE